MTGAWMLRDVVAGDLPVFFSYESDPEAVHMAAFTPEQPADRAAFDAHWSRVLAAPSVTVKTVVCDGRVAGSVLSYEDDGGPEVSYWIGRPYWGRGIATWALREFIARYETRRPLRARVAKDNLPSIRVLEKCGFVAVGEGRGFANGRGAEIEEWIFQLAATR